MRLVRAPHCLIPRGTAAGRGTLARTGFASRSPGRLATWSNRSPAPRAAPSRTADAARRREPSRLAPIPAQSECGRRGAPRSRPGQARRGASREPGSSCSACGYKESDVLLVPSELHRDARASANAQGSFRNTGRARALASGATLRRACRDTNIGGLAFGRSRAGGMSPGAKGTQRASNEARWTILLRYSGAVG
jgi:hypothetical protein